MKKMIIRADDVGYTHVFNLGTFEAIRNGVVTSADVMLESPGTVEALELLKDMQWISVGWHTHFWCSPVLPVEEVPSLLIPGTDRFRHDIMTTDEMEEAELYAECQAQMKRCVKLLGRAPDTTNLGMTQTLFNKVKKQICDEYGIAYQFGVKLGKNQVDKPLEKWADRKIFVPAPVNAYKEAENESITEQYNNYDPVKYYTEDPDHLLDLPDNVIVEQSWHPGYVDYFVYKQGDYGPRARYFTAIRTQDVEALTSQRLKDWIKEHKIELINFRDALYGTNEYQNYLHSIDSDLYIGNM